MVIHSFGKMMQRKGKTKKSAPPKRTSSTGDGKTSRSGSGPSTQIVTSAPESASVPSWFSWAIAEPCENIKVTLPDEEEGEVQVQCFRWGRSNTKQGLVMVHGGGANAHWYRFIAPFFASDFDVVAITTTGNGDSSHRSKGYSMNKWSGEVLGCCEKLGLFAPSRPRPFIVAHSLGTSVTIHLLRGVDFPADVRKRFGGVILVDGAIRPYKIAKSVHEHILELRSKDPTLQPRDGWPINPPTMSPASRFKLRPYQECDNAYIVSLPVFIPRLMNLTRA